MMGARQRLGSSDLAWISRARCPGPGAGTGAGCAATPSFWIIRGRLDGPYDPAMGDMDGMHGFPRAGTSFLGGAAEVAEVDELLAAGPLVMVTGPGGVGKTRLACEVAARAAGRFADGAWLVELAAVHDGALVPAAVAAVTGVPPDPALPVAESLAA